MARWKKHGAFGPVVNRPDEKAPLTGPLAKREKTADTHAQIHTQDNCALYVNGQEI